MSIRKKLAAAAAGSKNSSAILSISRKFCSAIDGVVQKKRKFRKFDIDSPTVVPGWRQSPWYQNMGVTSTYLPPDYNKPVYTPYELLLMKRDRERERARDLAAQAEAEAAKVAKNQDHDQAQAQAQDQDQDHSSTDDNN